MFYRMDYAHQQLRAGDTHYLNEQYELAEESYRKAKEKDGSVQAAYNLGNSLYAQERYEEAVNQYLATIGSATDDDLLADTYYNLGNAHVANEKLEEGIEAYKSNNNSSSRLIRSKMKTKSSNSNSSRNRKRAKSKAKIKNSSKEKSKSLMRKPLMTSNSSNPKAIPIKKSSIRKMLVSC